VKLVRELEEATVRKNRGTVPSSCIATDSFQSSQFSGHLEIDRIDIAVSFCLHPAVLPEVSSMIMAACYVTCSTGSDIGRGIHRRMPHCRVVSDDVFFDAPTRPSTAYSRVILFLSFLVVCVDVLRWKEETDGCVGESQVESKVLAAEQLRHHVTAHVEA
jgi:hypothetical protein